MFVFYTGVACHSCSLLPCAIHRKNSAFNCRSRLWIILKCPSGLRVSSALNVSKFSINIFIVAKLFDLNTRNSASVILYNHSMFYCQFKCLENFRNYRNHLQSIVVKGLKENGYWKLLDKVITVLLHDCKCPV